MKALVIVLTVLSGFTAPAQAQTTADVAPVSVTIASSTAAVGVLHAK